MITTKSITAPHLRPGHQIVVAVPACTREQLPTYLSAGEGVVETARYTNPEQYDLTGADVARRVILTVEHVHDDQIIIDITASLTTFAYDGTPERSAFTFHVLPTFEIEVFTDGIDY